MIYLDYQATTPLAPEVAAAMRPWVEEKFANPHSPSKWGREAAAAIEVARDQIDRSLGLPGGRFAFTIEEGVPLAAAERERMPDADTVWLTPLDDLATSLERAGLVVTWQEDHSRAHHEMAQALAGAFAADSESIAAQIGRRALDELLAAHRLWVDWLGEGRVRKLALVTKRAP